MDVSDSEPARDDGDLPAWWSDDQKAEPAAWIADEVVDAETFLIRYIAEEMVRDPDVRAGEIHVGVQDGVVILEGEADSPGTRSAAARCAWSAPGVRDVCNMLIVWDG